MEKAVIISQYWDLFNSLHPKFPPLYYLEYPFLVMDPKNFLFSIYTSFEGTSFLYILVIYTSFIYTDFYTYCANIYAPKKRAKKNAIFLSKFPKECLKTPFLACFFFQNFACGAESFAKIGIKQRFGRARKINLIDPKKIRKFFLKIRPHPPRENAISAPTPLEKMLYPPLIIMQYISLITLFCF